MARNVQYMTFPIERHMGEDVMIGERFRVGDRVRARVATIGVPAGAPGTVQSLYMVIDDLYEVLFDGLIGPYLMREDELEPETESGMTKPSPQ